MTYCYAALRHTNKRPQRHPTMRPQRHTTTYYYEARPSHFCFFKKTFKMPQYSWTERRRESRGSGPRNATIFGHTFFFCGDKREVCASNVSVKKKKDLLVSTLRHSLLPGRKTCIRQHTVSIRQHTSAYVSIRQHTVRKNQMHQHGQHTSAYISIRQHTSAYVSVHGDMCFFLPGRKTCCCEAFRHAATRP
jgi:hypothetical protein